MKNAEIRKSENQDAGKQDIRKSGIKIRNFNSLFRDPSTPLRAMLIANKHV
jgi:hypothetical protein